MRIDPQLEQSQDVKSLLEENLKYAKEIYTSTEKTRRYILWGQVFGFLKIIIILVPLVLGFLYLQPYLKSALGMYSSLFGQNDGSSSSLPLLGGGNSDLLKQLEDLQKSGKLRDLQKLLGQ
ncbi:MAG: hypothetical protein HY974_01915 [Candidatus Kerfeldbacteria bacterium]|nr:hypothetical protein [Candidatus Kerfeldbacteria bacterium]